MNLHKIGNFWVDFDSGEVFHKKPLNNSMQKFDLNSIGGQPYNVQNQDTGELMTIKVIDSKLLYEVIRAHTLLLEDPNVAIYDLIDCFTGFATSPWSVSWFTTANMVDVHKRALQRAAEEGNSIVIIEIIPKFDADLGGRPPIVKVDK